VPSRGVGARMKVTGLASRPESAGPFCIRSSRCDSVCTTGVARAGNPPQRPWSHPPYPRVQCPVHQRPWIEAGPAPPPSFPHHGPPNVLGPEVCTSRHILPLCLRASHTPTAHPTRDRRNCVFHPMLPYSPDTTIYKDLEVTLATAHSQHIHIYNSMTSYPHRHVFHKKRHLIFHYSILHTSAQALTCLVAPTAFLRGTEQCLCPQQHLQHFRLSCRRTRVHLG